MLATATHDHKRGEDVRARPDVLSEIPDERAASLARWSELNRGLRPPAGPGRLDEHLLYQTLLGIWPPAATSSSERAELVTRVRDYTVKAAREAGERTTWEDADARYEDALRQFGRRALRRAVGRRVPRGFRALRARRRRHQLARPAARQAHRARDARHVPGRGAAGRPPPGPRRWAGGRCGAARRRAAVAGGVAIGRRQAIRACSRSPPSPCARPAVPGRGLPAPRRGRPTLEPRDRIRSNTRRALCGDGRREAARRAAARHWPQGPSVGAAVGRERAATARRSARRAASERADRGGAVRARRREPRAASGSPRAVPRGPPRAGGSSCVGLRRSKCPRPRGAAPERPSSRGYGV